MIETPSLRGSAEDPPAPDGFTEEERQFYVFGFHRVLTRFFRLTALGWGITAIGALCLLLFWRSPLPHGGFDLLMATGTFVAGLIIVQTNLAALQSYVTVRFPDRPDGIPPEQIVMLREWMREVAEGGWRDAYAVLRRLEAMKGEQQGAGLWPTV